MVALTEWSTPSSAPTTATAGDFKSMQYVNGYFVAVFATTGMSNAELWYAADPTGTWTQATLPSPPSGTDRVYSGAFRLSWDGTYYAAMIVYGNSTFSTIKARVVYATDLGGTWTSYEFDSSDLYRPWCFRYMNGQWVAGGIYVSGAKRPAFLATCSTPGGTWSFDTSASGTGLDTADLSSNQGWIIREINYADGNYVYVYWDADASHNPFGSRTGVKTSTSLSSGWAAPSSILSNPSYAALAECCSYANGYWFVCFWQNSDAKPYLAYTDDPAGTWSSLTPTQLSMDLASHRVMGVAWDGTNYVLASGRKANTNRYTQYLASTGSPDGTYTNVTSGLATAITVDIAYGDPYHVVVQYSGQVRYSNAIPFPRVGPSLLRQRQSPLRTPARVRGVDLRQRQTPYIT